ncbi:MAG: hypothetical protein HQL37_07585, partial [Alphaproteobacteria bacterium]|nr:hypothetical protein [Alphaproteobacteria bacterium]
MMEELVPTNAPMEPPFVCNSSPGIDMIEEVSGGKLSDGSLQVAVVTGKVGFTEADGGT